MNEKQYYDGHSHELLVWGPGQPVADERAHGGYPLPAGVTGDTLMVTPDGLRPIADLRAGDEVLTHKGRYRPVTAPRQHEYQGEMLSLQRARCNTPLHLTPHQPVIAVRAEMCPYQPRRCLPLECRYHRQGVHLDCPDYKRGYEREWLAAGALCQGDWVYFPPTTTDAPTTLALSFHPYRNAKPIPTTLPVTPALMAWLGYFVAQGSLRRSSVQFSHRDRAEIKRVALLGRTLFNLKGTIRRRTEYQQTPVYLIRFYSRALSRWMISLIGHGVAEKHLPEWVFGLDAGCRQALLRAILRSDGCFGDKGVNGGRAYHYATASVTLAHQVTRLLLGEGVACGVNVYDQKFIYPQGKQGKRVRLNYLNYRVDIHNIVPLYPFLDPPGSEPAPPPPEPEAKVKNYDSYPFADSWLYTVKKIERQPAATTTVYTLEVDDDHSYVTMAFGLRAPAADRRNH